MSRKISQRILWTVIAAVVAFSSSTPGQEQASNELVEMVIGFLADEDKDIRSLAFDQVRSEAPGEAATKRFAAELPKLSGEAQIGLLSALGDRGDRRAKPAVVKLLNASDTRVRNAAINALGDLGSATDCASLIELLSSRTGSTQKAVRQSLVRLRGDDVSREIANGIRQATTPVRVALIEVLAARRALDTIPSLLQLSVTDDAEVRAAAMAALGQIAGPQHVAGMAKGVLKATRGAEKAAAEKNLMFVCQRIEDRERRAEPLLAAMKSLSQPERIIMLSTLGRIGGKSALTEVEKAIASRNLAIHAAGIRAISNWPDASVAKPLMDLAKSDKHQDHRRIARMALIRIAPLPDGRTNAEKLTLLQQAMKLATRDAERNYALKRAAAIRLPETLRFVLPYLDQTPYAQQACETIVELAHDRQLRDDNKPEFHAALDRVISTTKDAVVIDRAQRYKKGQTWVRPK